MKTNDALKDLIDRSYENIPVPEGLEQRLSAAIDAAACRPRRIWLRVTSVAAAVALAVTLGLWLPSRISRQAVSAETYTLAQVDQAYLEAERVLLYVSQKMNGSMEEADRATQCSMAIPAAVVNKMIKNK